MMDLGRVDADVTDLLDARADPHVDRVAVDDADDRALEPAIRRAFAAPRRRRHGQ